MVETFTPAGCGGRIRAAIATTLFGLSAVAAAAAVGLALGAMGAALPHRAALIVATVLAVAGVAREFGVVRFRIPESRRQVPEPWRREKPLAVWTTAYGAILGSGFGTFQPAITYWVTCCGVLALGDPVAGALCLAPFGLGRLLMVVAPGDDALRRLAGLHRFVRPANGVVLAILAILLLPAAASAASLTGKSEPAVSNGVIAYTEHVDGGTNVVVNPPGPDVFTFPGGRMPSLNSSALAYADGRGIRVVLWQTGQEALRLDGNFDKPAIGNVWLVFVHTRDRGRGQRLIAYHLGTRRARVVTSVGPGVDIGRPSVSGHLVAWHEQAGSYNAIALGNLRTGRTGVVAAGARRHALTDPVVRRGKIAWIDGVAEITTVVLRDLKTGRTRSLGRAIGPRYIFTTTAMDAGTVFVTRWDFNRGRAQLTRYR